MLVKHQCHVGDSIAPSKIVPYVLTTLKRKESASFPTAKVLGEIVRMPLTSNKVRTYTYCKQKTDHVFDEIWNFVTNL